MEDMKINYTGCSYEIELPNTCESSIANFKDLTNAVLDYCGIGPLKTTFPKLNLQINKEAKKELGLERTEFLELIVSHYNKIL